MAKKYKLKKNVMYKGLIIIAIIFVALTFGKQKYDEYVYKKTYEYKLMQKGYSKKDANEIEKLYKGHVNDILKKRANDNLIPLAKEKYFIYKNLDAYLAYIKKNKDKKMSDVIAIVNTHADNDWYTHDINTDTSLNERLIVNKFYHLSEDYKPDDIVDVPIKYAYDGNTIRKLCLDAFKNMWNDAMENNIKLIVNSGYRDYSKQASIYEDYSNWYGEEKADTIAARAGYSEHQTGLALDILSSDCSYSDDFENSEAYKWLKNNAYKYGFIERYPKGKEYLTGYAYESWHWRYVGKEAASIIQKENITYDEYYAYYIEK